MNRSEILAYLLLCSLSFSALGETVKDREGAVRGDRAKMENSSRWIYNDIEEGFKVAKENGKPLMVVLRCVPCLACMGIDTQVLMEDDQLTPLMDQFVRVRVINANALDLSKFQFDYDLSFSTMFFNGDGTVYGRYGSWEHQKDPENKTIASYQRALEGALKIHENYPGNKASLAGKQGKPNRYKTPVDMPELSEKYRAELDWQGKVVQSCVHCHQIGDAKRLAIREKRQPMPLNLVYSFPSPLSVGIELSSDDIASVTAVSEGSPAALAGLKPGDTIEALDGQPLISAADFNWVLHNSPDAGKLTAIVRRSDARAEIAIPLSDGWRRGVSLKGKVGTWPMRAMAFGGMLLEDLPDEEREKHDLGTDDMALLAKHVGQYNKHAAAKRQGFKKDDILIEVDGSTERTTESQLLGDLIRKYQPGKKVPAKILRDGKEIALQIPIQ